MCLVLFEMCSFLIRCIYKSIAKNLTDFILLHVWRQQIEDSEWIRFAHTHIKCMRWWITNKPEMEIENQRQFWWITQTKPMDIMNKYIYKWIQITNTNMTLIWTNWKCCYRRFGKLGLINECIVVLFTWNNTHTHIHHTLTHTIEHNRIQ